MELIAKTPASPRDHSRLLIYDTAADRIIFDRFYNLHKYLPPDSFLVLNKTKVVPARIFTRKQTGGSVELLLFMNEWKGGKIIRGFSDRKIALGQKLRLGGLSTHALTVTAQEKNIFTFRMDFAPRILPSLLTKFGLTPIPPYIRHTPLHEAELRKKYQSVFAQNHGSIAAPTASLHFTPRVFRRLATRNISQLFVTLHAGLGTFAPVTEENLKHKKLHEEYYEIEEKTAQGIRKLRRSGKRLIAVGTTTVRTLESYVRTGERRGTTDLFIMPPYSFQLTDGLITNFHLPGSSLLLLVEAFLQFRGSQKKLADLYQVAIRERFRFYSFGDAMVIV